MDDAEPPTSWYRMRYGWVLVGTYIAVVVLGAAFSTRDAATQGCVVVPLLGTCVQLPAVPASDQTIPGWVYLFSTFGTLLWGLWAVCREGWNRVEAVRSRGPGPRTADGDGEPDGAGKPAAGGTALFAGEPRELLLRPFAALPLAAGVYLLSGVLAGGDGPSTTAIAVLALFVGLYLHRTYDRLGRIADSLRRDDDGAAPELPSTPDSTPGYRRPRGALLVAAYLVATAGVLVATAETSPFPWVPDALLVPVGVYLYALLGVMGRIFTELIRDGDLPTRKLELRGLRIPIGMLLAGAVYLVLQLPFESFESAPYPLAGLAFIVGLYEGVGFTYISSAGKRLLPTAEETADGEAGGGGAGE